MIDRPGICNNEYLNNLFENWNNEFMNNESPSYRIK